MGSPAPRLTGLLAGVPIALVSALACATGLPTQATRVVQPEPGRAIQLALGEQVRIDAPSTGIRWSLTGGEGIITISPAAGDRPAYWILTARQVGEAEVAFEGVSES
ncbi:MAG: hypothetical protein ACRD1H_00160, partial [Vicinamibacterales bacterium]